MSLFHGARYARGVNFNSLRFLVDLRTRTISMHQTMNRYNWSLTVSFTITVMTGSQRHHVVSAGFVFHVGTGLHVFYPRIGMRYP